MQAESDVTVTITMTGKEAKVIRDVLNNSTALHRQKEGLKLTAEQDEVFMDLCEVLDAQLMAIV